MYVYLSVEDIMSNFRAIMVYVFHFWTYYLWKSSFSLHLNKALIDQKHVYVCCLFGTGWMRGLFLNFSSNLKPGANKKYIAIIATPL